MSGQKILMVGFGALDLFAFYNSFPKIMLMVESYTPGLYQLLLFIMVLSLLVSGPLFMLGNKVGYAIYYFQFPLRIAFKSALTFGFIFTLTSFQPRTFGLGMLTATIFGLEAVRLMLTIQRNKVNI